MFTNLEQFTPFIAALAITSLVILVSDSFVGYKKILFASSVFSLGLALSIATIVFKQYELSMLWIQFKLLSKALKFTLSILVITLSYFGGTLYAAGVYDSNDASILLTPASCDNAVDFDVPSSIPDSDDVFFEKFLER